MISNDLTDNFIPKSNTGKCKKCKKYREMFTCEVFPKWIPDEAMDKACPHFEPMEGHDN